MAFKRKRRNYKKVGEWSEFRSLTDKDSTVFYEMLKEILDSTCIPISVSMKVDDGVNYKFLAERHVLGANKSSSLVIINVYIARNQPPKIISIEPFKFATN